MIEPLPARSIVDTHTHTRFSDGVGTFMENAAAAVAAGCRVMVSTDHLTLPRIMDPGEEVQVPEARLAEHRARSRQLQLSILSSSTSMASSAIGTMAARRTSGAGARARSCAWGRCIGWGPSRAVPGSTIRPTGAFEELGPDEVWRRYAEAWCRACECPLFDTMAHPDLAMRFVNDGFAPTIDLAPLWDEMVACAHDTGKRVELSTAGWRKGVGDYYPARGLARAILPRGRAHHRWLRRPCAGRPVLGNRAGVRPCGVGCYRTVEVPRADGSWEQMEIVA